MFTSSIKLTFLLNQLSSTIQKGISEFTEGGCVLIRLKQVMHILNLISMAR